MTVRRLIQQLLNYPNLDAQVLDTDGSPIMYSLYHSRETGDDIRLEPKAQMDIDAELDAYFKQATDTDMSDRDTCDELKEMGYTLDDLRCYRQDTYEWALQYWN